MTSHPNQSKWTSSITLPFYLVHNMNILLLHLAIPFGIAGWVEDRIISNEWWSWTANSSGEIFRGNKRLISWDWDGMMSIERERERERERWGGLLEHVVEISIITIIYNHIQIILNALILSPKNKFLFIKAIQRRSVFGLLDRSTAS